MAEYIEKEPIVKETESIINFRKQHNMDTKEYESFLSYIKSIPAADVTDVVHCSECKQWTGERCRRFSCPPWAYCYTRANDFCSGGDRK